MPAQRNDRIAERISSKTQTGNLQFGVQFDWCLASGNAARPRTAKTAKEPGFALGNYLANTSLNTAASELICFPVLAEFTEEARKQLLCLGLAKSRIDLRSEMALRVLEDPGAVLDTA